MYIVIPWDAIDETKIFDTFIEALQYGNINYGGRYDLIEEEA